MKIIKVAFEGSDFLRALISTQFLSMCLRAPWLKVNKKPTLLNIRRGRKLFKVIDRKLVVLGIKELNVPMAQVKRPTKAYLF